MKTKITPINATLTGLGALTALAATAHAATVQITLTGNQISTRGRDTLAADITGDGINDLTIANSRANLFSAEAEINGSKIFAFSVKGFFYADVQFATRGVGTPSKSNFSILNINYLNPITFTDSRINDGAVTNAWLQVNAVCVGVFTVALTRVIFDNTSTTRPFFFFIPGTLTEATLVPEPSGLALLALGAGGLLTRRKRQAA